MFEQEWNYLYPSSPWLNNTTSGSKLLAEERPSSRLIDPAYSADYQHIKDNLSRGNLEEWDVTALVFALKYSHALSRIRYGYHWRRIENAMYQIKYVRNTLFSHACKAAISRSTFESNIDVLVQAVGDLLSGSDPLVDKLRKLRYETEFPTKDLLRYKHLVQDDYNSLLLLEQDLKRLEGKMTVSAPHNETTEVADTRSAETSDNSKIISRIRRRMGKLEREVATTVDQVPSRSKPAIFHSARYIRLINRSFYLSYNFRWAELQNFFQQFSNDIDMETFAGIQSAVALSHQSRKEEAMEVLNELIPKVLLAKHG